MMFQFTQSFVHSVHKLHDCSTLPHLGMHTARSRDRKAASTIPAGAISAVVNLIALSERSNNVKRAAGAQGRVQR